MGFFFCSVAIEMCQRLRLISWLARSVARMFTMTRCTSANFQKHVLMIESAKEFKED